MLKDQHEEAYLAALPEPLHASIWSDLLGAAMAEVNWNEIAEALLEDVRVEA